MQPETPARPMTYSTQPRSTAGAKTPTGTTVFVPILLLALAFVGWLAFQATQQITERRQLGLAQTSLEPQEQAATKLRAALDALALSTAKLAADGNANARVIVEELRKRGVTINSDGASKPK